MASSFYFYFFILLILFCQQDPCFWENQSETPIDDNINISPGFRVTQNSLKVVPMASYMIVEMKTRKGSPLDCRTF